MTLHLPVVTGVDGSRIGSAAQGLFDMEKKAERQTTQGRRGAPRAQRCDAAHHLSLLGIDGELTSGLRDMYATSLLEPLPDKFLDLLVRLSTPVSK
ncbi:NepR family anti-sigma factor [Methylocystis sp. SC2]|uniref:NepR family anti-sigma factor n=1 Tax=Methylocystis sp. (strain SC2) TaxID=187303 RepID=UPI0005A54351|nr:NepR family anti-sigma factor [Methylocystis sp. SC2]